MPTAAEEQKKIDDAQKRAQDVIKQEEEQDRARQAEEATRREEIVYLEAPEPDTVSNKLAEDSGYYVRGRLVDPDGVPLQRKKR